MADPYPDESPNAGAPALLAIIKDKKPLAPSYYNLKLLYLPFDPDPNASANPALFELVTKKEQLLANQLRLDNKCLSVCAYFHATEFQAFLRHTYFLVCR